MRALRLCATGLWLLMSVAVCFALGLARGRDPSLGYVFGRMYAWGARRLLGLRVDTEGAERLAALQPCIYVINHQSNLDMATMGILYPPRTVVIGKKQLLWFPLFGAFFWFARNILIDRKDRTQAVGGLRKAVAALREHGWSIWTFPEGTRNKSGKGLLPFKKGPFVMAISAQVPVVPIVSSSLPSALAAPAGSPGRRVRLRVLDPEPTAGLGAGDTAALSTRVRERMLAALGEME
ncbi:MAG: lysophospholipid acyltransferase family protein [Myxococcota bacterium]